ncbi:phage head morphogenesis protein [Burkholderia thailandensis]|uniref:phage head morphogenesis protein n=1 Tax=Burkholderia thailandensis TaxID=57975 RepID=UPI0012B4BD56|nr:phage minor head protein [Burkholderia thailandensis]ALJ98683.1 head morphogenesis protein [Burkholderia phage PE067]NOK53467.1 phage head morphogenesis protein [Burkholderia thailandensis]
MPARAPKAKGEMRATRPSAAVRIQYQRALERLVDEMHRSTLYWLRATYRDREREIAADASPAADLAAQLARRAAQWRKMFAARAPNLARWFIAKVDRHATNATKQAAVAMTGMSVSVKDTLVSNTVMQASIQQNVSLIKSIQSEYATEVEGIVMRSVTAGRDLKYLTDQLQERYGVTRRRATFIATDQNNKATAQMARARQLSMGVTKARWLHVGGGKNPRHSHVEANGKVFDLSKGLKIDGEYIFPGELPDCGCVGAPLIPGVDDEAE